MDSVKPINSPPATASSQNPIEESPRPPKQRQSSVRFADGTNPLSRSPMSRTGRSADHGEVTPIRTAEGAQRRNYNTGSVEDDGNTAPKKPKSNSPETEETSPEEPSTEEDKDDTPPWYKRIAYKYGSISLENKGSVARDHLALERTFLAWLRTSLAFASIGVAITQLFRLNTTIARSEQYTQTVPFSPYLGQSVPAELLPYLQQAVATGASTIPKLGPTLLDQLLLLPPAGEPTPVMPVRGSEFDDHAAAKLRHVGKPLGATFLAISIIILFIGFHRYFEAQHWIIRGKFPASRGSIFIVGFITSALIIASLVVVIVIAPSSFQKKVGA